jgi:hypothetical protein
VIAWLLAEASPSPSPLVEPPGPAIGVPELVIGVLLGALGIRSLVRWMSIEFQSESFGEHALYVLHTAARVGLWFAFAAFFIGLALVDETARFIRWYLFVPLALAGVQLMTAVFLGRSPVQRNGGEEQTDRAGRE